MWLHVETNSSRVLSSDSGSAFMILRQEFGDNKIGLFRDDGLSCFWNLASPESEKIKKKLYKIFKQHGLNITVECI